MSSTRTTSRTDLLAQARKANVAFRRQFGKSFAEHRQAKADGLTGEAIRGYEVALLADGQLLDGSDAACRVLLAGGTAEEAHAAFAEHLA